jgi:hypothetical protein
LNAVTKTPRFITGFAAIGSNVCRFQALLRYHWKSDCFAGFVMREHIEGTGFIPPSGRALGNERRSVALAALIATAALAFSTIVAATVVSIGIARANVIGNVVDNEGSLFAIALVLGLLFIGMGGLTIMTLPGDKMKNQKPSNSTPSKTTLA